MREPQEIEDRQLSTIYEAVTPAEREALAALRVRAELAGVFIGEDRAPVATPLDSRMIVTAGPCSPRSRSSLASLTTPPRALRYGPRSKEGLSMA